MRSVNLLPPHYTATRLRNTRRRQALGLTLAAGCICLAWAGVLMFQLHGIHRQLAEAHTELQPLEAQWADIEATRLTCDQLSQKVATLKRLRDPIALNAVLARLTQLFPDDAVLMSLCIDVPPVSLPQLKLADSPQARKKTRSSFTSSQHQQDKNSFNDEGNPKALLIELQGLVSSDVIVAQLASQLAQSGLFRNVRIEDARQITFNEQPFHQFRLKVEIPVYQRPTTQLAQGPVSK